MPVNADMNYPLLIENEIRTIYSHELNKELDLKLL